MGELGANMERPPLSFVQTNTKTVIPTTRPQAVPTCCFAPCPPLAIDIQRFLRLLAPFDWLAAETTNQQTNHPANSRLLAPSKTRMLFQFHIE